VRVAILGVTPQAGGVLRAGLAERRFPLDDMQIAEALLPRLG
jgi:hypothetical protein